ncbi:unnamed protein product [Scytosiphon promiscuus]
MGQEHEDEVDSPPPPCKRYRNDGGGGGSSGGSGGISQTSTKTRIASFPAVEARVRTLKSKADDRSILTLLRQLKHLQGGSAGGANNLDSAADTVAAGAVAAVGEDAGGSGTWGGPVGGGDLRSDANEPVILTEIQIEELILEEL